MKDNKIMLRVVTTDKINNLKNQIFLKNKNHAYFS
jgi:hypothetical protein